MNASIRDALLAAKAQIDTPEKWAKGPGTWGGDRQCASEALNFKGTEPPDAVSAALPLRWKARQWLRGRWSCLSSTNIIRFNDHPDTTHADVMDLFDRAIARAS